MKMESETEEGMEEEKNTTEIKKGRLCESYRKNKITYRRKEVWIQHQQKTSGFKTDRSTFVY